MTPVNATGRRYREGDQSTGRAVQPGERGDWPGVRRGQCAAPSNPMLKFAARGRILAEENEEALVGEYRGLSQPPRAPDSADRYRN